MARRLQKWHGAGNDFLVDVVGPDEGAWWNAARAAAACDRHRGLGADGVLVAELTEPVVMRLFNADGTRAEMSGNGVRCLVGAVARTRGLVRGIMTVLTDAGRRDVDFDLDGAIGRAEVSMGPVELSEGPSGTLGLARVGNPHVVVRDDADWDDREREQRAAAWAARVGGANVEFIEVLDESRVRLRVIERGVGWTLACGTGSCAVAATLAARGEVSSPVEVFNPGGALRVTLGPDGARLAGPMQYVGALEWDHE